MASPPAHRPDSAQAFRNFLAMMGRRILAALIAINLVLLATVVLTSRQEPKYESIGELVLRTEATDSLFPTTSGLEQYAVRSTAAELTFLRAEGFEEALTETVGEDVEIEISEKAPFTTEPGSRSDILVIRAVAPEADQARDAANAAIDQYINARRADVLDDYETELTAVETQLLASLTELDDLLRPIGIIDREIARTEDSADLAQLLTARSSASSAVERSRTRLEASIDRLDQRRSELFDIRPLLQSRDISTLISVAPEAAQAPFSPSWPRNMALGAFLAATAAVAAAIARDALDDGIQSADHVARLGLPVLASLPTAPRRLRQGALSTIAHSDPASPYSDGYQRVRTSLEFISTETPIKTVLITSPKQGDGKTTVATNLALTYASVGRRVVLADIDFRRPQIDRIFGTDLQPGISDVLTDGVRLPKISTAHPILSDTLRAIPAGAPPENPAALLSSPLFAKLLTDLRSRADLTILDAPPVLPVADALAVAPLVDGVVIVVSVGDTTKRELSATVDSVTQAGGRILGIVVNRSGDRLSRYSYGRDSSKLRRASRGFGPGRQSLESGLYRVAAEATENAPDDFDSNQVKTVGAALARPKVPTEPDVGPPQEVPVSADIGRFAEPDPEEGSENGFDTMTFDDLDDIVFVDQIEEETTERT